MGGLRPLPSSGWVPYLAHFPTPPPTTRPTPPIPTPTPTRPHPTPPATHPPPATLQVGLWDDALDRYRAMLAPGSPVRPTASTYNTIMTGYMKVCVRVHCLLRGGGIHMKVCVRVYCLLQGGEGQWRPGRRGGAGPGGVEAPGGLRACLCHAQHSRASVGPEGPSGG